MERIDARKWDETRPIQIKKSFQKRAYSAVIIEVGETIVNCCVSFENKVPSFLDPEKEGWLTAEYSMLPGSTGSRSVREAAKGKQSGRTVEIQRLIGRSLRAVVDLKKIPGKTIWVDCDVLQADGGTRTASISGASVALNLAFQKMIKEGEIKENPMIQNMAAISLGVVSGEVILDLNYHEDSRADVDMNLIMTERNEFIELQMTSEGNVFTRKELDQLIDLGTKGINEIVEIQKQYIQGS